MHATLNDLSTKTRAKVVGVLNARLADAIDLQFQAKQAHWNVKGPNFIALHELFDTIAGDLGGHADDMAERVTALGGTAEGTIQAVAGRSKLPVYPLGLTEGRAHLEALAGALARFGKSVRKAIDETGKAGVSRGADKNLWLIEAHLQADR
jgi:starvation-inducible DNA-binding protein